MTARNSLTARIVSACAARPVLVLLLALLLGAGSAVYAARHFAMTTDTAELLSDDLPFRQAERAYAAAFPGAGDLIAVVVDGATPELAESATAALFARVSADRAHVRTARRPDGGPFFDRNGILLLPETEVQAAMDQLIAAQPFLGPLVADPSLRGVMGGLSTFLLGVERGQATLADLQRPVSALADALGAVAEGRFQPFSWRNLIAGQPAGVRETRRFILVQPVLDYTALSPGAAASRAIRAAARELGLVPERGVRVRLTGAVPMADEEFATLAEGAEVMTAAMLGALLLMLWLAVRSVPMVAAILLTTLLGLVVTAALGLAAVGRFNLISVAFIPLFVGLGVDFGIQVCVRCRAERLAHPELRAALRATGGAIGRSLALAALAIAAGFLAFLPTSYLGVSELGAIAGLGMVVAFLLSITLLPALVVLFRPRGEGAAEVGYPGLAPLDAWLRRHHRLVLGATGALALGAAALLPLLRFDFNPLHLRSPEAESMSTLADLMADPDRTPNTISVLAPTLEEADRLAARLAALPEVAGTLTLSTFIPRDQPAKLAAVADARDLLGLTFAPVATRPAPSDAENVAALASTAAALRRAAGTASAEPAEAARRLAGVLDRLEAGPEATRRAAEAALVEPLNTLTAQIRALLEAGRVTRESLPPEIVADWIATDGRARVQVMPAGNSNDNEVLRRFSAAVRAVAPEATGAPISIQGAADSIVAAFAQAGALSFVAITLLLALVLRRVRDVALAMGPVVLSGVITLGACAAIGLPLNFANIIALPLLFGIGVAFNIYYVMAARAGQVELLPSSLTRAVVYSALTTATAFGSLWLSHHPGTASMGQLLMLSLGCVLAVSLLAVPSLLEWARRRGASGP